MSVNLFIVGFNLWIDDFKNHNAKEFIDVMKALKFVKVKQVISTRHT